MFLEKGVSSLDQEEPNLLVLPEWIWQPTEIASTSTYRRPPHTHISQSLSHNLLHLNQIPSAHHVPRTYHCLCKGTEVLGSAAPCLPLCPHLACPLSSGPAAFPLPPLMTWQTPPYCFKTHPDPSPSGNTLPALPILSEYCFCILSKNLKRPL